MKIILPFVMVILLTACVKSVYVKVPSKCAPTPIVMGCAKIQKAYKDLANSCKTGLQICQRQIKRWSRQCASKDAELNAIENPK